MKVITSLVIAALLAAGGYLLYTKYFSGEPVERKPFSATGAPLAVRLDPSMNPVRVLAHASFEQQVTGGARTNRYLARLATDGRVIAEREVELTVAQAAKPSRINNTSVLLDANVPAPSTYTLTLEPRGTPQFDVRNIEIEFRRNAK
jgi:hypothetical protein